MAVKQRIIRARISNNGYGAELYYDQGVKFSVISDTGPVSASTITGSDLNYSLYTSSGGANGNGISYSKLQVDGFNGGTSYHSWFNIYWDKTDDYDASTVGIPGGINNLSETGVSINLDEDDCEGAFDLLTKSTPSYIYIKAYAVTSSDRPISTKVAAFDSSAEITLYLGYNAKEATLTAPGTPTITENYNGTYTAKWSAATGSGGSGDVYYQLWDVNNGGWWSNWNKATQVTLNVPSYGHPYEFRVRATYDGASSSSAGTVESWSGTVTKTFTAPSVTKPGAPTITQNSDGTFKASWTAATGSSGTGSVSYQLYYGSTAIGSSTTGTSITANIPGYGTAYSFTVKATYSGATATSNATSYTFVAASLTAPGTPTVTNDTSKYTVTWTAATGKNGVGSVYYRVITTKTDGSYVDTSNWQTALTYTANIPSNGTFSIAVEATYNNASSTSAGTLSVLSNAVQKTMAAGSLTAPGAPTITQNYDGTFTAKWTAATGSGNSGSVYYRLYNVTDNTYATNRITGLTATVNVPAYGVAKKYRVYATYGGASASINGAFTTSSSDTTVTFDAATLATPGAPTITQNANGTFTASWSAATGSYGVGNVYYQLINDSTGVAIGNRITERTATYNITDYNVDTVYKIKATYNGATATADGALVKTSSGTTKTFLPPVLSTPVLSLAATSGNSASLSWTAATLNNATGTVNYTIIAGNETVATTDKTAYTINEATIAALSPAVLKIQATATNLSNTASGSVLTTTSNTAIFTYVNELVGASNLKVTGTNVANLTWTAGSTSYGTIVYDIYLAGTVVASNLSATTTSYTIPEKTVCKKTNAAIYILTRETNSGEQATSNSVNFTYSPSYTAPSGLKTNGSGSQAIISWNAGTTTYGTMTYDVYANGTKVASNLTSNSYTIFESTLASMNKTVTIYITYKVAETGVSGQLSSVSFTYTPSVIKHTVGYRQGGRNHNCLVYVCVNGAWVKCAPYIYTNGKWQICSTT